MATTTEEVKKPVAQAAKPEIKKPSETAVNSEQEKPSESAAEEVSQPAEQEKPAEPVAKAEEEKPSSDEKIVPAAKPSVDNGDYVIASVKQRYTLNLGVKTVVHEPGIHKMPREEAEHEFAKIRGTLIVGIPETGTLNDYHAQEALSDAKVKAQNLVLAINGLVAHLTELTDGQKKVVESSLVSAQTTLDALSSLG